jgi:hypothetical protein
MDGDSECKQFNGDAGLQKKNKAEQRAVPMRFFTVLRTEELSGN